LLLRRPRINIATAWAMAGLSDRLVAGWSVISSEPASDGGGLPPPPTSGRGQWWASFPKSRDLIACAAPSSRRSKSHRQRQPQPAAAADSAFDEPGSPALTPVTASLMNGPARHDPAHFGLQSTGNNQDRRGSCNYWGCHQDHP
jgi:hypothetical protein